MFKIKDGYKLEIQTPPTMTLFGSKKNVNRQKKEWKKLTRSWSTWSSLSPMQFSRLSKSAKV